MTQLYIEVDSSASVQILRTEEVGVPRVTAPDGSSGQTTLVTHTHMTLVSQGVSNKIPPLKRGRLYIDMKFNRAGPEFDFVSNHALQLLPVFHLGDDEEFERRIVSNLTRLRGNASTGADFDAFKWGTVLSVWHVLDLKAPSDTQRRAGPVPVTFGAFFPDPPEPSKGPAR